MYKNILVIGATGNIGSKIVRHMRDLSQKVKAAYRPSSNKKLQDGGSNIEPVEFDYTRQDLYNNALSNVDGVFLLAPPLDAEAPQKIAPFIKAAQLANVKKIVFISAFGADKAEGSPIRRLEKQVINSGIDYTIVRPTFFMENFTEGWIAPSIRQFNAIHLPAGKGKTGFISSEDIAEVISVAFTKEGFNREEVNLTGPELLDHFEVAEIISETIGHAIKYVPINESDLRSMARQNNVTDSATEYMIALYKNVSEGKTAILTDDVKKILCREPESFREFAERSKHHWLLEVFNTVPG